MEVLFKSNMIMVYSKYHKYRNLFALRVLIMDYGKDQIQLSLFKTVLVMDCTKAQIGLPI